MVAETHVRAIADLKDTLSLKGIYARRNEVAADFALKALTISGEKPKLYASTDELASDDELDFVIIATPPNARLGLVEKLAGVGLHILMEKPVERNSAAASEIVQKCARMNVHLGIVFQHRRREASIKLREMISANSFGQIGLVEASVPWWREQAYYDEPGRGTYERDGGGVLISQAIHTLDLMLSLAGPVTAVQAMSRTTRFHDMESEDFVCAGLDFENGAVGSVVASTASFPGDAESISMHFDKASVLLKSGVLNVHWRDGRQETFGANATTGGGADPMAFTHEWHRDVISDFARCVADGGTPICTGAEALHVHRLIDAMVHSSRTTSAVQLSSFGEKHV
jgi:predicted dehydrogenase